MGQVVESERCRRHTQQQLNSLGQSHYYILLSTLHLLFFSLQDKFSTCDWQVDVADAVRIFFRYACLATFRSCVKPQLLVFYPL